MFTRAMLWFGVTLLGLGLHGRSEGQPAVVNKAADAKHYDTQVRPFLAQHCLECHGAIKPKGDFRVDRLAPSFADPASREQWQAVLKRIAAGEMPPKSKPRPPEKDVRALSDWIGGKVQAA